MPAHRFVALAVDDKTTDGKPMETLIRKRIGEIPILQTVIQRLRLREILLSYIKPHGNETVPVVSGLLSSITHSTTLATPCPTMPMAWDGGQPAQVHWIFLR